MGSNWKISLPKDADGREIPLNTTALYDKEGNELCVKRIEFDPFNGLWRFAVRKCSTALANIYCSPQDVHLEKPAPLDSWEKLEEDLDRCIEADCVSLDVSLVLEDIKQRIRKLRG